MSSSNESVGPPFGKILEILHRDSLQAHSEATAEITKCEYLASFNWLNKKDPTIVVPGMPPEWAPLVSPERLLPDSGTFFRDINAAHYAKHSIEPAVRAILAQRPNLVSKEVDIFACGSTIGHLLRFIRGTDHVFRFVVELIGETVFLVRRERSPTEKIEGVRGYGHTFPENYTTYRESVRPSDSHQRLIKYEFAGFECIIRHEGDGYLPEAMDQDPLDTQIARLPDLQGLHMTAAGREIPQDAIFDLKTRSVKNHGKVLEEELPRLWVRQIPWLILAYYERGMFNDIRVQDVRSEINSWEKEHQDDLRKLAALLARIVVRARDSAGERFEVCCRTSRSLELRQIGGDFAHALPEDLGRMWAGINDGEVSSVDEENDVLGSRTASDSESVDVASEKDSEPDYTACSTDCEYCGRCQY